MVGNMAKGRWTDPLLVATHNEPSGSSLTLRPVSFQREMRNDNPTFQVEDLIRYYPESTCMVGNDVPIVLLENRQACATDRNRTPSNL